MCLLFFCAVQLIGKKDFPEFRTVSNDHFKINYPHLHPGTDNTGVKKRGLDDNEPSWFWFIHIKV